MNREEARGVIARKTRTYGEIEHFTGPNSTFQWFGGNGRIVLVKPLPATLIFVVPFNRSVAGAVSVAGGQGEEQE
jgi:hypothetical protein